MVKVPFFSFNDHPKNPLIKAPFPEWVVADPFVLTPDTTPDRLWYLFAHTILGLRYYTSTNGINWSKPSSLLVLWGYRPFIYTEHSIYHLLYEKVTRLTRFPFYGSQIEMRTSTDLLRWSSPQTLLAPTLKWHCTAKHQGNVGNPSLIKIRGKYHLYYSAGLVYLSDYKLCEPTQLGLATSTSVAGPYTPLTQPLISPVPSQPFRHISTHRPFRLPSGLISLQTHLHHPLHQKSRSAIHLATSSNGRIWSTQPKPLLTTNAPWKKSHVFVADLKRLGNRLLVYYNGRSGWLFGHESIGLAQAKLPK